MKVTNQPQFQTFNIEGIMHINPVEAFEALKEVGTFALDVREPEETLALRMEADNVLYHPLSKIMDRLQYIPRDKFLIVACATGERSVKVANLLQRQGFPNVANLDGGIVNWRTHGLPVLKSNRSLSTSCGCGCSPGTSDCETPTAGCCGCDCDEGGMC
jgi:rhodanese-related sulfurtransferase